MGWGVRKFVARMATVWDGHKALLVPGRLSVSGKPAVELVARHVDAEEPVIRSPLTCPNALTALYK